MATEHNSDLSRKLSEHFPADVREAVEKGLQEVLSRPPGERRPPITSDCETCPQGHSTVRVRREFNPPAGRDWYWFECYTCDELSEPWVLNWI